MVTLLHIWTNSYNIVALVFLMRNFAAWVLPIQKVSIIREPRQRIVKEIDELLTRRKEYSCASVVVLVSTRTISVSGDLPRSSAHMGAKRPFHRNTIFR